jgi:hypothetical protein
MFAWWSISILPFRFSERKEFILEPILHILSRSTCRAGVHDLSVICLLGCRIHNSSNYDDWLNAYFDRSSVDLTPAQMLSGQLVSTDDGMRTCEGGETSSVRSVSGQRRSSVNSRRSSMRRKIGSMKELIAHPHK